MEDNQIVKLYWDRNQLAIEESRKSYDKLLKRISINILASFEDSEECVNDTYLNAWNAIPPQKPNSLAAYLGRITRNLSINRWHEYHAKKRYNGGVVLLSELSDCIPASNSVEDEIETEELTQVINNWLRTLLEEDRILFLRRYWYCESVKVLAKEYSTTPNKLAGRMFRLRIKLKQTLEGEGICL